MQEPTVIVIVGPTAVGKTAAAVELARQFQTKIISADSRQCYKELNIGVAKPSNEELDAVEHYFINSHSVNQEVNAAVFEDLALHWTEEIFLHASQTVMVGGTGLYIKAFEEGLDDIPAIDPGIRKKIQEQFEQKGLEWLQGELREQDPAFYINAEIANPQRLMRALEVRISTGHSILDFQTGQKRRRPFRVRKIGLELPREELNRRIDARVDRMLEDGLVEEVTRLVTHRERKALQTVGYRELFTYLDGLCSLDEATSEIKKNTRRYAKRQMTWFKKDPAIEWTQPDQFSLTFRL